MPGLVKVGYTMKEPELRAAELNHTGAPHPYNVHYDVLLENPREVEQQVHCHLKNHREGKEWFRCTTEEAITTIKAVAGVKALLENIKYDDSAESILGQKQKTILERDIPSPKKYSKEEDERETYNQKLGSLMKEFKDSHKFTLESWKAYARKNRARLEPIPKGSKKWLD